MESEDDYHSSMMSFDSKDDMMNAAILGKQETILEKNKKKFPYFRGIFHDVDIEKLDRVSFSYVKLPEDYNFGEASGRKECEISRKELNDKYIGIAHFVKPEVEGLTNNDSKNALLRVKDRLISRAKINFIGLTKVYSLRRCA